MREKKKRVVNLSALVFLNTLCFRCPSVSTAHALNTKAQMQTPGASVPVPTLLQQTDGKVKEDLGRDCLWSPGEN